MEEERRDERPLSCKLHVICTTMLIMTGMAVLDAYLVEQNEGSRRTGVFVMLLIGDVCLLLVLRYVALWVGTEVRTTKRGCSMVEWFLFIFVLDIKMYFVLESFRADCPAALRGFQLVYDVTPLPLTGSDECQYTLASKKTLTLFQSVVISGLYLLLVGGDHLRHVGSLRALEEIKMRAFWVVADLLDVLELQSSMWESGELPYLIVGFVYFYCYIALIVLPPLSLAEMGRREDEVRPHEALIYLFGSLCIVNVGSTAVRLVLLLRHNFAATSSIFIGKNIVCIGMKLTTLIQIKLVETNRLRFADPPDDVINIVPNGDVMVTSSDATEHKCDVIEGLEYEESELRSECPEHGYRWKPSSDVSNFSDFPQPRPLSDCSTLAQIVTSSTPLTNIDSMTSRSVYDVTCSGVDKRVKFDGKRPGDDVTDFISCSMTSELDNVMTSLHTRPTRSRDLLNSNAENVTSLPPGLFPPAPLTSYSNRNSYVMTSLDEYVMTSLPNKAASEGNLFPSIGGIPESESDVSELGSPPPSMTLMSGRTNQNALNLPSVESRQSILDSDAESTSV